MTIKALGMAAIALACSAGICAAQQAPTPPNEQQRQVMQAVAQHLNLPRAVPGAAPVMVSGGVAANGAPASAGWNYFHAYYCSWYLDSSGNQYFYVWPSEGGYWYAVNNLYAAQGLQISCANGNWEAVYVTNTSSGAFDETYSYPYH